MNETTEKITQLQSMPGWTFKFLEEINGKFVITTVPVIGQVVVQRTYDESGEEESLLRYVVSDEAEESPATLDVFKERYVQASNRSLGVYQPGEEHNAETVNRMIADLERRKTAA
jgi:hypothetical protein